MWCWAANSTASTHCFLIWKSLPFLIWQYIAVLQGATKHPCSLLYRLPFACLLFLLGLPTIAAAAADTAATLLHPSPHRPAANCGCKGGARGGGAMRAHARCVLAACTLFVAWRAIRDVCRAVSRRQSCTPPARSQRRPAKGRGDAPCKHKSEEGSTCLRGRLLQASYLLGLWPLRPGHHGRQHLHQPPIKQGRGGGANFAGAQWAREAVPPCSPGPFPTAHTLKGTGKQ